MSDVDSDSTIEPDENDFNNSPDLFDDDVDEDFNKISDNISKKESKPVARNKHNHRENHGRVILKVPSLQKKISRTHEISDSDSDDKATNIFKKIKSRSPAVKHVGGEEAKMSESSPVLFDHKKSHSPVIPVSPSLQKRTSKTHEISEDSDSDHEKKKIVVAKQQLQEVPKHRLFEKSGHRDIVHGKNTSLSPSLKKRKSDTPAILDSVSDEREMSIFGNNKKKLLTPKESALAGSSASQTTAGQEVQQQKALSKSPSLKKRRSQTHEISDSDSDTDRKSKLFNKKISISSAEISLSDSKKTVDLDDSPSDKNTNARDSRPLCQYGSKCVRKNPSHFEEYKHTTSGKRKHDSPEQSPVKKAKTISMNTKKSGQEIFTENQPISFYVTKVTGIPAQFNALGAIHIKDILSASMGNLVSSCQFNFMFEIPWLMQQYPAEFRTKPVLLVHGEQRGSKAALEKEASAFKNITCCQAKLEIMYGTHHTKMMLLLYDRGMRVVIHTANLIERDWYQKSQGVWISPLFPKLPTDGSSSSTGRLTGDSPSNFKKDLLAYIGAYNAPKLTEWEKHIKAHDMSSAKVHIIGSVPGRHAGERKNYWGHLKLRKVLQEHGPEASKIKSWPVIGQFSSVGSLGPSKDTWLCKEWLQSLSATRGVASLGSVNLQLVFPSVDNVRISLEGYPAGGSVPYSINTAKKQIYVHSFFRQWKAEGRGRTRACPHIKTYMRPSPDSKETAWFLVTSANLSKAAWGALEKNQSQLMIRSYEIGVLFLPKHFGRLESFPITTKVEKAIASEKIIFPLPYDLPLSTYEKGDRPWMWDVPCVHLPDCNGNMWCPQM